MLLPVLQETFALVFGFFEHFERFFIFLKVHRIHGKIKKTCDILPA
jgi:hypothetical protein